MWKKVLAGTTALVIVGATLGYAQQRPGGPDGARGWQPTTQDVSAFTEARIAALRAGLMLTPDQEKNWPAFEQAYRGLAKLRAEMRSERRDEPRADNPIDRLQRRADALTRGGTALKHLADAAAPLYQSLDDGQKRRFVILARPLGPHGHFGFRRGHHGMGPGMGMGPRMGMGDDRDWSGWRRHRGGMSRPDDDQEERL
jgi:zinc resistance-associated protein